MILKFEHRETCLIHLVGCFSRVQQSLPCFGWIGWLSNSHFKKSKSDHEMRNEWPLTGTADTMNFPWGQKPHLRKLTDIRVKDRNEWICLFHSPQIPFPDKECTRHHKLRLLSWVALLKEGNGRHYSYPIASNVSHWYQEARNMLIKSMLTL